MVGVYGYLLCLRDLRLARICCLVFVSVVVADGWSFRGYVCRFEFGW